MEPPTSESRFSLFQGIRPLNTSAIPKDVVAGFTLAAMNIPEALGYTRIAGTPVITGLYTLLLPMVAFAVFGSSRFLVVAADSATAAILAGGLSGMAPVASSRYVALASLVALTTAALLLIARLLRLGFLADFLSQTVLVGFLTGVGFQVGIGVLGDMLGIETHTRRTAGQLAAVIRGLPSGQLASLAISAAVVALIVGADRFLPKLPSPLLAVAGAILASATFDWSGHGIAVLGPLAAGLPHFGLGAVSWSDVEIVLPTAGSCFVMIVAQSAATARAYAALHKQHLDENQDLLGLAAANTAAGLSGTFVVNGSLTQTSMLERSGGRSQMAHLATASLVLMVLLFLTGPLQFLPRCVLGAVVFTIAIRLVDLRGLLAIRRESPGEFLLAATTAAVVVLVGVEQGILLAMTLSLLRIVQHSYHPHTAVLVQDGQGLWRLTPAVPGARTAPDLAIYRFGAPVFYANANRFAEEIHRLVRPPSPPLRWLVIDAGAITHVDYTAARIIRDLRQDLEAHGTGLVLAHVQSDLKPDLDRHHLTETIGPNLIFDSLHEALAAIRASLPAPNPKIL